MGSRWIPLVSLLLLQGLAARAALDPSTQQLERSWGQLDQQLRLLDQMLPTETESSPSRSAVAAPLPSSLLEANQAPQGPLAPAAEIQPSPPLDLPTAPQLKGSGVQGVSLSQTLAIGLALNPTLQAQRLEVASALADLQAQLGSYWPRVAAFGGLSYDQSANYYGTPQGNNNLGFGANYAPNSLVTSSGGTSNGAFYVPSGAQAYLNQGVRQINGGLQLRYELLDFARTPLVQAAQARLQQSRQSYANGLRELQLRLTEAYYQLQRADQLVLIRDADVRNDLVILGDVLALKQAGLVPRLDLLRRQAIEAEAQEQLVQALADRAVARRRLAVLLNLPPQLTPAASDPIQLQPAWPLNLEESLLAAYRDNPELEAVLATRQALAREKTAVAAQLLPRLGLFANGSGFSNQTKQWDISGNCCGVAVIPNLNLNGSDWAVGLAFRWLLFDAGSTAAQVRSLAKREEAQAQRYASQRNDIRLRLEQAFFQHEASLAKLVSARRGVAASLEGFRDAKLRYQTGLANEVTLSLTQDRLIQSLVQRLNATIEVNLSYAQLLRELLPVPRDPDAPVPNRWTLPNPGEPPWSSSRP
ncbi:MAG: TolC family protein [Synechococcus lacustris]